MFKSQSIRLFSLGLFLALSASVFAQDSHKTMLNALSKSELSETLRNVEDYTLFAPADQVFWNLPKEQFQQLFDRKDPTFMENVLRYHIVAGKLSASRLLNDLARNKGKASYPTLLGDRLHFKMEGLDILLVDSHGNKAKITQADISTSEDQLMHGIDGLILPPTYD
jgi:uncharacterized surface protein with fasciclin (FAS1) repeats